MIKEEFVAILFFTDLDYREDFGKTRTGKNTHLEEEKWTEEI